MDVIAFQRWAYTVKMRRNLSNRFRRPPSTTAELIVPVVNAVPMFKLFDDRYPGLAARLVEPTCTQWNGTPTYTDDDGRAAILDGICGEAVCCGVLARIDFSSSSVRWHDFRTGPTSFEQRCYEFDRSMYESAILEIGALSASTVTR